MMEKNNGSIQKRKIKIQSGIGSIIYWLFQQFALEIGSLLLVISLGTCHEETKIVSHFDLILYPDFFDL